jgi:hypothetical protein
MSVERIFELLRERLRKRQPPTDRRIHAEEAMRWLYAAQDSSDDRGVAYGYWLGKRWMRSYPETTGYIIPTLLNWARLHGESAAEQRAIAMAEWELEGQLESGAVPNLTDAAPTVFDTGQVIFGWVAAYRHGSDLRYLDAARRGADWLISELDDEGIWRHASDAGGPGRVYNVRAAWAVLELSRAAEVPRLADGVRPFLDWTLSQERSDGWFDRNCLTQDATPLLHTIAYTARGQLESGLILGEQRYVDAARRTVRQLLPQIRDDGFLPGRFDRNWQPAAGWACLTGMAQTSIVLRRLAVLDATDGEPFRGAAARLEEFLMRTQDRSSKQPGLRGGIRGSYPVNGQYGQWRVLNWATKFFVDSMMLADDDDALFYRG